MLFASFTLAAADEKKTIQRGSGIFTNGDSIPNECRE
jgi:hypothetical protein